MKKKNRMQVGSFFQMSKTYSILKKLALVFDFCKKAASAIF